MDKPTGCVAAGTVGVPSIPLVHISIPSAVLLPYHQFIVKLLLLSPQHLPLLCQNLHLCQNHLTHDQSQIHLPAHPSLPTATLYLHPLPVQLYYHRLSLLTTTNPPLYHLQSSLWYYEDSSDQARPQMGPLRYWKNELNPNQLP